MDAYNKLQQKLDTHPAGAPDRPEFLEILRMLFTAEEAYVGSCTAKTTIYCANIAAGMMLAQFAKWLRRLPVEPDITINLLSAEFACYLAS